MRIRHVEIWTDVKCNGGTHQATIPTKDLAEATLIEDLDGKRELTLALNLDSTAWSSVENKRVLRVAYTDASVDEFRIDKSMVSRDSRNRKVGNLKGMSIQTDLKNGIVSRTEANHTVSLYYTLIGLTRAELVTLIVAAAPSYFTVGTISDDTEKVPSFTFNFDSPLSSLKELADMEDLELEAARNGDTDYPVNLVDQIGAGADQPEFRYRKNMKGVERTWDSVELMNQIWPAGGSDETFRLSVGEATWEVTSVVSTTVVELGGEPIYEDDVLNGKYLEEVGTTNRFQITDSDATLQRVTTGSAHGLSQGDLVTFREDASGTQLVYVESLLSQASYDVQVGTIEEDDLPYVRNLVANPSLSSWSGGLPVNWSETGTDPVTTEETSALYTMAGGSSAKIVADEVGEGLKTDAITIVPVDPNVFYSLTASVYLESGEVELYAVHSTEGRFPLEGGSNVAATSELDKFIELTIAGKEWPTGTVTIYIVARSASATFYIDSCQLTNTASEQPFFDGDAARVLWQRGLRALEDSDIPYANYRIDCVDLYAADQTVWPYDEVVLGGDVYVEDEEIGVSVVTRVVQATRDLLHAHTMRLELSNRPIDLIDILTKRRRRVRQGNQLRPGLALLDGISLSHTTDGTVELQVFGAGATRSVRYIVDSETMPTYQEVTESGGDSFYNNTVDGTKFEVTEFRNTPGNNQMGRAQRVFCRVVAYPILDGVGLPGATETDVVGPTNFWSAEIVSSEVVQSGDATAGEAIVTRSYEVDTRCTAIRVYRKVGGWPTKTGTQTGPVDPNYDRGTIGERDNWEYSSGGRSGSDVVYDVSIAIDINGGEGEREEASYTVVNTGSSDPRITDAYRTDQSYGSGPCDTSNRIVRLTWALGDCTDGAHDIKIWRQVDSGVNVQIYVETSPVTNTYYDDDEAPMWGWPNGDQARSLKYTIQLIESAVVIDQKILNETLTGSNWYLCITPE